MSKHFPLQIFPQPELPQLVRMKGFPSVLTVMRAEEMFLSLQIHYGGNRLACLHFAGLTLHKLRILLIFSLIFAATHRFSL